MAENKGSEATAWPVYVFDKVLLLFGKLKLSLGEKIKRESDARAGEGSKDGRKLFVFFAATEKVKLFYNLKQGMLTEGEGSVQLTSALR